VLAIIVIKCLYPGVTPSDAADIIVPHHARSPMPAAGNGPSPTAGPQPGPIGLQ
jgi:hypothetical protein